MHRRLISGFLLSLLLSTLPGNAKPANPSEIKAVTLYPSGALISREVTITLEAGANEIDIENLPSSLLSDTLQVQGRGTMPVSILDVGVATKTLRETRQENLRKLEAELIELRDQETVLSSKDKVLKASLAYLDEIVAFQTTAPEERPAEAVSASEWRDRITFQEAERTRLFETQLDIAQKQRELKKDINQRTADIAQLRATSDTQSKTVTVKLNAARAGDFVIELNYIINEAGWSPDYLIQVSEEEKRIDVTLRGTLKQRSGEDWDNVAVSLSTVRPALTNDLPELTPWRLRQWTGYASDEDVIQLSPFEVSSDDTSGYRASNSMSGTRLRTQLKDIAQSVEVLSAEFLNATTASDLLSATFELPYTVSIPSQNSPQTVNVATIEVASEIYHWSIPKLDETAYLKASGTNPATFPLLAGKSQVFVDGRFVGNSIIEDLAPGEELNLILGPSPRVQIDYKLIEDRTEDIGFGGKTLRRTYTYHVEIENFDDAPNRLVLRDQIPLSTHEEIEIELLDPTPAAAELDDDGILIWRLDLKPREKRTVSLKFQIEHPANWRITAQ